MPYNLRRFVAVRQWKRSNVLKEINQERQYKASVKMPLIQRRTSRILTAAQFLKNFELGKIKLLRKTAATLLPSNQSDHVTYQTKLAGLEISLE